jgi:murein DD-endopeptidase MepM/ murein hydrolase activator NlpD
MGNGYQARRNNEGENDISPKELAKENSREVVKTAAKEAGNKYLEANGVPAPLAQMATDKLEKNKLINKAINKVADNKQVSNMANKLKPGLDSAGLTKPSGGSNMASASTASDNNSSGLSKLKNLFPGSNTGSSSSGEAGGLSGVGDMIKKIKSIPPWLWPIIGYTLLFFFAIIIILATLQPILDFLGVDTSLGTGGGYGIGPEYKVDENSEQGKFYKRVTDAYNSNKTGDKKVTINAGTIASTYTIINRYNSGFTYANMDEATINTLIDNMLAITNSKECTKTEGDQTDIKYVTYKEGEVAPACPEGYTTGPETKKYAVDMEKYYTYLKTTFIPEKINTSISEEEKNKIVDEIKQIEQTYISLFTNQGSLTNGGIEQGYVPPVASGEFGSPLNKQYIITSPYQETLRCLSDGTCNPHYAIDLDTTDGSINYDILASADGNVSYVGNNPKGCGNEIRLRHNINGKIYETRYCHLSSILVTLTDPKNPPAVYKGQKIGISGNTGHSFGVHLHFEVREGIYYTEGQKVINPTFVVKNDSQCLNCK